MPTSSARSQVRIGIGIAIRRGPAALRRSIWRPSTTVIRTRSPVRTRKWLHSSAELFAFFPKSCRAAAAGCGKGGNYEITIHCYYDCGDADGQRGFSEDDGLHE